MNISQLKVFIEKVLLWLPRSGLLCPKLAAAANGCRQKEMYEDLLCIILSCYERLSSFASPVAT